MTKRGGSNLPKDRAAKSAPTGTTKGGRAQPRLIREYKSKAEREAAIQRLIILGVGAVLGIAALILVVSIAVDAFVTPQQTVATVNGESITVAQFRERVRLERALINEQLNDGIAMLRSFGLSSEETIQQLSNDPQYGALLNQIQVSDQLGNRVLNSMIDDVLVRQQAEERGITVSDAEVDAQIARFFGYDPEFGLTEPTATPTATVSPTPFVSPTPTLTPTVSPTPTASPTPEFTSTPTFTPAPSETPTSTPNPTERAESFTDDRDDFFGRVRGAAGISDAQLRTYFEAQALRVAVRDAVLGESTTTAPWVNARHILVESQTAAEDILASLAAGESFADLARSVSTDTGSGANGGELGWSLASRYVTEFAEAVRDAEIGAFVGPVQTDFGFHVIQVRAREERPLEEADRDSVLATEFENYIDELRDAEETSIEIFDTWTDNVPDTPRFVPRGL